MKLDAAFFQILSNEIKQDLKMQPKNASKWDFLF